MLQLQPLSMESKAALALLSYLPLTPQVTPWYPCFLVAVITLCWRHVTRFVK